MATPRKKTKAEPGEPEAVESYRARALVEIKHGSITIPAGATFGSDSIPFDASKMELLS